MPKMNHLPLPSKKMSSDQRRPSGYYSVLLPATDAVREQHEESGADANPPLPPKYNGDVYHDNNNTYAVPDRARDSTLDDETPLLTPTGNDASMALPPPPPEPETDSKMFSVGPPVSPSCIKRRGGNDGNNQDAVETGSTGKLSHSVSFVSFDQPAQKHHKTKRWGHTGSIIPLPRQSQVAGINTEKLINCFRDRQDEEKHDNDDVARCFWYAWDFVG